MQGPITSRCGKRDEGGIFVGVSTNPRWPYRYTLVRDQGRWSGEVEYFDGQSFAFSDEMEMQASQGNKLHFLAHFGEPGDSRRVIWTLKLSDAEDGFDGLLVLGTSFKRLEPVELVFERKEDGTLPSTLVENWKGGPE